MSTLKISLKANEKIYVNGAVIKTDRKVTLEFLNIVGCNLLQVRINTGAFVENETKYARIEPKNAIAS